MFLWKNLGRLNTFMSFSKIFQLLPMLESRNVDHVKSNSAWDIFCEKIQADITVSWAFHKYFNYVPMLESRNVDYVKSNFSWDMFLWKHLGRLNTFMNFSTIFQFCTHARITKCGHMKSNCSDITVSSFFHNYLNIVPMLESRNMDHMKSNCSWDMFCEMVWGGLHTFMSFSEMFLVCTHARIT